MKKIILLITFFILVSNSGLSQCNIDPYIEANYTTDAWILFFRNFVENPSHPDYDTPILDVNKITPYLEKISAVYEQTATNEIADSLFNVFSIHANPWFPQKVPFSKINFWVSEDIPWVLDFIDTGVSGEPILDQLMIDYSFTITEVAIIDPDGIYDITLESSIQYLNTFALLDEFSTISDIGEINTGFPETPYNYNGIFYEINNEEVRSCNIEVNENIMSFSLQTEDCWNGGCSNAKTWEAVISEDCSEVTIVLDVNSNNNLVYTFYPNPTSNSISFTGSLPNSTIVTIYNIQGQIVKTIILENKTINVSTLISGMYFLKIQTNDGRNSIQKFIKN